MLGRCAKIKGSSRSCSSTMMPPIAYLGAPVAANLSLTPTACFAPIKMPLHFRAETLGPSRSIFETSWCENESALIAKLLSPKHQEQ